MKKLLAALMVAPSVALAQPAPATYTVTLTEQQIEGIIQAGAACLDKAPYACAEYAIYIRNLLTAARKPEAKKD